MDRSRCAAVVGMACRFPGGESLEQFWDSLTHGKNFIREIPADRWHLESHYSPDREAVGKSYVRHAGFLDELVLFITY